MDIWAFGHEATCISQDFILTNWTSRFNRFAFSHHKRVGGTEITSSIFRVLFVSSANDVATIEGDCRVMFFGSGKDQFYVQN
jgi:hypothetical protein